MKRPEAYWINRPDVIGLDVLEKQYRPRQAATYEAIAALVKESAPLTLLDIGCNIAALENYLRAYEWQGAYTGIDTNLKALSFVQHYHATFGEILQGNLRALPFPAQAFDCVVVKDVIEHLEGLTPLAEAFRVTRKALILACYIPFSHDHETIEQHPDGYYTNTYAKVSVLQFAARHGFSLAQTIETHEANGTPNEITVWERVSA